MADLDPRPDEIPDVPPSGAPGDAFGDAPGAEAPEGGSLARKRHRSRRRRAARAAGFSLVGLVALVALAALAVVLYVGSEPGRRFLQQTAVEQIALLLAEDATVEVGRLEGNFLTGAQMTGLVIRRDGETVLTVDTVYVDYTLRTLVRRTFSAKDLGIAGATLIARQREDGSFNVAGLLRPREDDGRRPFTVQIDQMVLRRSRAEVRFWPPSGGPGTPRDSVLVLDSLDARVENFYSRGSERLDGRIAHARAVAVAPFDAARLQIAAAGQFTRDDLALERLAVNGTGGTRIRGRTRLTFQQPAGGGRSLPVFTSAIDAAPLALADVRAFVPVPVYGDPRLRLTADSDGRRLAFSLSGALDGGAGGPATLSLDGDLTRDTNGPLAYSAEGTLRRLDLGALTRNPALAGSLTGDLRLDLRGTEPRALAGAFSVSLRESRFAGRAIDRLRLDGDVAAGRVRFDLDGRIPGLDLEASGEARPFDPVPAIAARARARDLDLAVVAPGQGVRGRLAGEVALIGQGTSVRDFTGTLAASLGRTDLTLPPGADGRPRRLVLDRAEVDADLDAGFVAFDATAALAGGNGRLAAVGTADTRAEPLRYAVTSGRLDGLNLAALTGDPAQTSRLTGTFTLDGTGTDPRTMTLAVSANLADSRFADYDLRRLRGDVRLARGTATVDLDADLGAAGGLTAAGTVDPFRTPLAFDLRGELRRVNLAALTGNPDQDSDLSGRYTARGSGTDPRTMTLDATLALTASRYGTYDIRSSDLTARLRGGELALTGPLDLAQGSFALDLTLRPFDGDGLRLALGDRMCFSRLDLGALTQNPDLDTSLNGCFAGTLAGLNDLPTARAGGTLTLARSTVNDAEIVSARVTFALAAGALTADLDATLPATDDGSGEPRTGRLVATVQARPFDARPTYAVRGRSERLDLGPFLGFAPDQPARFTATFDLTGAGLDPETMTLEAALVAGGRTRVGPVRVDTLDTRLGLADGILRVDHLTVNTDVADAEGAGTLALFNPTASSSFALDGRIESLAPLAGYFPGTPALEQGTFSLTANAAPGQPLALAGRLDADRLVVGEGDAAIRLTRLDGELDVRIDRARLAREGLDAIDGQVAATFDTFRRGTVNIREGRLAVTLADGGDLRVLANAVVDQRRDLEVALTMRLDTDPFELTVADGTIGIDDLLWRVAQPARIVLDDGILVRGLALDGMGPDGRGGATGQRILADGRLDPDGEQDFVITVENVRVETFADLAGYNDLGGALSATLALSGPAEAPVLDGRIRLDGITARGQPVGALDVPDLAYADGRLRMNATLTHVSGETLLVRADIPRRFAIDDGAVRGESAGADDEVTITARANAFPIGWLEPFLDDRAVSELSGTLRLNLTVTGTQARPQLDGIAMVSNGRFGAVATGMVYPFLADVTFRGNEVSLDDVRVVDERSGETRLRVGGNVRLRELSVGEFNLTITPTEFMAMDTRSLRRLVVDAGARPLRLTGTLTRPQLRGAVALSRGDIYVTDDLVAPDVERVDLTDEQLRTLEARFGRVITARDTAVSRFADALDYDLTVQVRRNVWVRSDAGLRYNIEFEGDVQAVKLAFAPESNLFGTISLVRGSVETLNRRFDVQRGTLTFNGPPRSAFVDLGATLDVRLSGTLAGRSSAQITLGVVGRLDDNPEIRLSSDPPMEPADILSVIATGQLADNLAAGSALGGALEGAFFGQIGGLLEGFASRNLGLDLAQVDVGDGGTLVIRVGKYLSRRLFFTGGFIVNPTQTAAGREAQVPVELTLEYQLLRWLAAQGEYSGQRGLGGGLETQITW